MKLLFGMEIPDEGRILIDGQEVRFKGPTDAMNQGIGMVHQHFMLGEPFTALDNLMLAEPGGVIATLDRRLARAKYQELAKRYGFEVDLDARVEDLPVGIQQRLEIMKVLARDPQILIFDEPTAVLTPQEVRDFFAQVRRLRDEGRTILLISHKLKEILELTDSVLVFRQGSLVGETATCDTDIADLAERMIGRRPVDHITNPTKPPGHVLLEVKGLSLDSGLAGALKDISFSVRSGEIIGIAGVEGNGQGQLLQCLTLASGVRFRGSALFQGRPLHKMTTAQLRAQGAAFFPDDRLASGMMENRPAYENYLLGHQNAPQFRRGPFLRLKELFQASQKAAEDFDVHPRNTRLKLGGFSGGNQQKFVVAREMMNQPKFILAAHPTRGVDLGAVRFIHDRLLEARDRGAGILLVSSELEELMQLSDHLLVMYQGQIVARFDRGNFDEIRIGAAMCGAAGAER
jgi:simple sugar transport system ATP-binding protein